MQAHEPVMYVAFAACRKLVVGGISQLQILLCAAQPTRTLESRLTTDTGQQPEPVPPAVATAELPAPVSAVTDPPSAHLRSSAYSAPVVAAPSAAAGLTTSAVNATNSVDYSQSAACTVAGSSAADTDTSTSQGTGAATAAAAAAATTAAATAAAAAAAGPNNSLLPQFANAAAQGLTAVPSQLMQAEQQQQSDPAGQSTQQDVPDAMAPAVHALPPAVQGLVEEHQLHVHVVQVYLPPYLPSSPHPWCKWCKSPAS